MLPRMRYALLLIALAVSVAGQTHRMPSMRTPTGGLAICARCEAPANPGPTATLTPANEPGEPLEISGTIYQADGHTLAAGVFLFVYHTDATGHYDPQDDPFAPRLRGWMRTGRDGQYSFRSIRPAPYPNHSEPAHIHVHIWSNTIRDHFLPEYWFAGDPLIKPADAARFQGMGTFSPIVTLMRGPDGVWHGRRDLRLDK